MGTTGKIQGGLCHLDPQKQQPWFSAGFYGVPASKFMCQTLPSESKLRSLIINQLLVCDTCAGHSAVVSGELAL